MNKIMLAKRVVMSMIAVVILGINVGLFKTAMLGVDPFTVLVSGLDLITPFDYGIDYIIINTVLIIFSLICDRRTIGIGTLANLFLIGYITQFSQQFFNSIFVNPTLIVRAACYLVGFVVLSFAASLYFTADVGVSTYDAIAITLSRKYKVAEFRYLRIMTDVFCVVSGAILCYIGGGDVKSILAVVGVGTIFTAFFMGPLVDFFNRKVSGPLLGVTTEEEKEDK